jgi:S-adenosylmethionine synthetase
MLKSAKIFLNGRFTRTVAGKKIPYLDIAREVIHKEVRRAVPPFDIEHWLKIVNNVHFSPGPGIVYDAGETENERQFFFSAPEVSFLQYHSNSLRSNDTSTGVGYAPLSVLEQTVLAVERMLNSSEFKEEHPFVGSDIKIMGVRTNRVINLTCCVPLVSVHIKSEAEYHAQLLFLQTTLQEYLRAQYPEYTFHLSMNTRDSAARSDFYLTLTGSAIESGDEGVVGRGNRIRGVIPFTRRMSMEASCGKNPVYHVGKVYTALCTLIAEDIYTTLGYENYVYATSQIGRPLAAPWHVGVDLCNVRPTPSDEHTIRHIVAEHVSSPDTITERVIRGEMQLYLPWSPSPRRAPFH